jgi:hypothetical protein
MNGPVQLFTAIALISVPTVMFGGYALLGPMRKKLTDFQLTFFKAGHAHAGVLLVLALVTLQVIGDSALGDTARWVTCFLLLFGVLAQSGGMFVHMAINKPGKWSAGNSMTVGGALLLAAAMLLTAYGVIVI